MSIRPINYFGANESEFVDPDTIMAASIPLELSGEAVRSRLCVFKDKDGDEYALRPDLTLPIALEEVEDRRRGKTGEDTLYYSARAWRLPAESPQPMEFTQVGFETFGAKSSAEQDVIAFTKVCEAAYNAGVHEVEVEFGDLGVFPAFVDALGLKKSQSEKIKRAFRQARDVDGALKAVPSDLHVKLKSKFKGLPQKEAESFVREVVEGLKTDVIGKRTFDDIAQRLIEKSDELGIVRTTGSVHAILSRVLRVDVPSERAAEALGQIAKSSGLSKLDSQIENIAQRFDAIAKADLPVIYSTRFQTPFGRRFNYYDGFVFEMFDLAARSTAPLGAGGRYDGLLANLSHGSVNETAIGGVLRPDRVAEAS